MVACNTKRMNRNTRQRLAKLRKAQKGRGGSLSDSKNMVQEVLHNVGEDGKVFSVTSYRPAVAGKPVYQRTFKEKKHDH